MANPAGHDRVCPTRIDSRPALFTHKVTQGQCQERQRGRYHKCYTCSFNNAYVAAGGTRKALEVPDLNGASAHLKPSSPESPEAAVEVSGTEVTSTPDTDADPELAAAEPLESGSPVGAQAV